MYKVRFLAIRLREYNQGYKDWKPRPHLFHVVDDGLPLWDPDREFFHGAGISRQSVREEYAKVEKDYGLFTMYGRHDEADAAEDKRVDGVLIQFSQDWPPVGINLRDELPERPRLGFISPRGVFYACYYGAHIGFARWIHEALFGAFGSDKDLLKAGWVQVNRGGADVPDKPTESQKAVLQRLYLDADEDGDALSMKDIPYKEGLQWILEELEVLERPPYPELITPGRRAEMPKE